MRSLSVSLLVLLWIWPNFLWGQTKQEQDIHALLSDSLITMVESIEEDSLIPYYLEFGHNLLRPFPDSALAIYQFATAQCVAKGDQQNEVYGLISQGYALGKLKQIDSSRSLYLQSIRLALSIGDSASVFEANELIAKGHFSGSDFENAASYYTEALLYKAKTDTAKVIQLHNRIALCEMVNANMEVAIDFQTKGLSLAQSFDDEYLLGEAYWQLGLINKRNNQVQPATGYFVKALLSLEGCSRAKCTNLIRAIRLLLANSLVELENYDSAALYFDRLKGDQEYIESPNAYGFYLHYGKFLSKTGKWEEAIVAFKKSNALMKDLISLELTFMQNNFNIGKAYFQLGAYDQALNYLKEATDWYEVKGNTELPNAYQQMAQVNYELGKFETAYDYLDKLVVLRDSLNQTETEKNLQELNTKYEVAEQQNKILTQELALEDQAAQNQMLLGGVVMLLVVIGFVFRSQQLKSRTNRLLEEKNHEISELERLKTRWFTNIAHELRTPLTLVGGPIEKVLSEENVNAPGKEDLMVARRNVKQLQTTIAEILDISRLEEGQLVVNPVPTHLSRMAKSAIAAFDSLAKQRQIALSQNISEHIYAEVDESKLTKTLLNLLMNAFKFTPKGGTIGLTVKVEEAIMMEVSDTGSGISAIDLPHVFDRFFQTKDENKALQGGTGIGLSLTREIVRLHGGDIEVISIPEEKTTFIITLPKTLLCDPLKEEAPLTENPGISEQPLDTRLSSGKLVILLVEDNPDMRQYIRDLLKHEYELKEAENGHEGLALLKQQDIDLIISDVMMPEMDGISFAKAVKATEAWAGIPFISVTALANESDKVYTLQIGVDDYLYKPFNPEELKVRVKNLLINQQERGAAPEEPGFDDALVQQLQVLVKDRIADNQLSATDLAAEANMSDRNLRRYLKHLTGLTPIQFIQELRLMKALSLLERKQYKTLKEVAHAVGIQRTSHFSDLFERRFGKRPQEYLL